MTNQSNLSGLSPRSIVTKTILFFSALAMSSVLASSMSSTYDTYGSNYLKLGTPWEKVITLDTKTMDSSDKDKNVYTSLLHIAEGIPHIDPLKDITASIAVKLDFKDATTEDACHFYACYTRFAPVNIPKDPLLFNENCFSFFFADSSKATPEKPMTKNFPLPTDQGYFSFYLRAPPKRKTEDVISCSATVKLSGHACEEGKIGNECSMTPLLPNSSEPMDITFTKDSFETILSLAPVSPGPYIHSVQLNGVTNKAIKIIIGDGFVPTLAKYTAIYDPDVVAPFTIFIRSLRFTTTPAPPTKFYDDTDDKPVAKLQGGLFKTYIRIISEPNDLAFITGFTARPLLCEEPTAGASCVATLVATDMSSALAFNRTKTASSLLGAIRSFDKRVNTTHINIGFGNVPYAQAITTEPIPQLKPYTIPSTFRPLISPKAKSLNPSLYLRMGAAPVLSSGSKPIFDILITSYAKDDISRFYALPPLAKFADYDLQWYYILVWDSLVTSENSLGQEESSAQNVPAVGLWFDTQCPRSCTAPHGTCPAETSFPVPPQDIHRCICVKGMMGWDCRTEESSPTPKPIPFWKQGWFVPVCIAVVVAFTLFLCICCVKSCKKKNSDDNIFPNAYEHLHDSEQARGIDERRSETVGQNDKTKRYGYQEGDSRSFTGGYLDSRNPTGRRKANPIYDASGTASGYGGLYAISGTASGLGSGNMNGTSNSSAATTNLSRTSTGHDTSASIGPSTSIDTRLSFENGQPMKPELTSHGLAVFTQKSGVYNFLNDSTFIVFICLIQQLLVGTIWKLCKLCFYLCFFLQYYCFFFSFPSQVVLLQVVLKPNLTRPMLPHPVYPVAL